MNEKLNAIKIYLETKSLENTGDLLLYIDNIVDNYFENLKAKGFNDNYIEDTVKGNFFSDKLDKDGGFNYILNICKEDSEIRARIIFLLKQFISKTEKDQNHNLKQLELDLANLLNKFPNIFIKVENYSDAKYSHIISRQKFYLSEDFSEELYKDYKFSSTHRNVNERLRKIFHLIVDCLKNFSDNNGCNYSELLSYLREQLSIVSPTRTLSIHNINENIQNLDNHQTNDINENDVSFTDENDNLTIEEYEMNLYSGKNLENDEFLISNIEKESDEYKMPMKYLNKLLTPRQKMILAHRINSLEKENSESIYEKNKHRFKFGKSTFYNEQKDIDEKIKILKKKFDLSFEDLANILNHLRSFNFEDSENDRVL